MITVKRFTALWCYPCKQLAPIMTELASEMTNVQFETIDTGEQADLAAQLGIRSIPCVVIYRDGTEVDRLIGVHPKTTYKTAITNWL
jgi:thioredoxin 1